MSARQNQGSRPVALVTGSSGAIGPGLIRQLLLRGYPVRALDRSGVGLPYSEKVTPMLADITEPGAVDRAASGADVVFHLAAKLHINRQTEEMRSEYELVNVHGTEIVLDAARRAGVSRFVFFSTVNVYGPSRAGLVWDETSSVSPDSLYAETKARAEELVRQDSNAVILRLGAVYGPRMKGNYPRLVNALKRGWFVPIGKGRNRRTLVHVEDVSSAAILAAEHPLASGETFNVTDGSIHTFSEIVGEISAALGKSPPRFHIPVPLARSLAQSCEFVFAHLHRDSPITVNTVDKMVEDVAVSGRKIAARLGFRPRFDLRTGWQETVRQMASAD